MTETTIDLMLTQQPAVTTTMLIRKPVAEVFEAFVDPAVTTRFWFTRGTGRLEPGARVQWFWDMYGASALVDVKDIQPNERILIEWGAEGAMTTVEWLFEARSDDTTFVKITHSGFTGDGDARCAQAIDSMGGFALVLAGAKALLEHDIELNLVGDSFPDGHVAASGSN
jgi:uncharacterized protein YndB with AHSA1/START domain